MAVTLDEIVRATRARVAERKRVAGARELERAAHAHVPRGFRKALEARAGMAVIAELKKASPSKGVIREQMDVRALACEYAAAGAAALSVLTEEQYFLGSLENLRQASAVTALPCLRKDFIVDEFQLLEARANAAEFLDYLLRIPAKVFPFGKRPQRAKRATGGAAERCPDRG